MKQILLICTVSLAALSSCTTAYKTGQTPDDVYYSPLPKQEEYTDREEKRENRYTEEYYDDRYLRMKVRNRYQWNDLNDWYSYERWGFGHNYYWGSYYNPYNSWNYFYNPYSHCPGNMAYGNPKVVNYNPPTAKPRIFNVGTYSNTTFNNNSGVAQNGKVNNRIVSTRPVYNNTNTNSSSSNKGESGFSRTMRTIFSGNENNSNRTYTGGNGSSNNSSRTYTPSSNSSSSSSSSSSNSSSSGSSSSGGSRPTRN